MTDPKVSIIMSTYNDASYITQAIDSVLMQDFDNWEYIIINDASSDATEKIVNKYLKHDNRFVYIKNDTNLGLTANLNSGIDMAKGKYIARIDSDDVWAKTGKLKKQVEFLDNNPDHALVGSWAIAINENQDKLYELKYAAEDSKIRDQILINNCFIHSSVLMSKDDVEKIGNYNPINTTSQDYELWLELANRKKVHNIPEYLVYYRINPNGTSIKKSRKQIAETISIVKRHKNFYPNYWKAILSWNIRKYYPMWLRGELSVKIKKQFRLK